MGLEKYDLSKLDINRIYRYIEKYTTDVYKSYDESVNQKYKVELNQRTIDRVKNSF